MDDCQCWKCAHPEASEQEYEAHLRAIIDRRGWLVQSVLGSRLHAPSSYTVGLTEFGLPELVVTGRRAPLAGSILDGVAGYTVRELPIRPGEVMHLGDLHLEAVEVPHPDAHLFVAVGLYGPEVRGLQMVGKDDRGRLPWERGHRGGRGGQPVFGPLAAGREGA